MSKEFINEQLGQTYEQLSKTISEACKPRNPLLVFGDGNASKLNYNLPQSSSFSATGYIPVCIDASLFKSAYTALPTTNPWYNLPTTGDGKVDDDKLIAMIMDLLGQTTYGQQLIERYRWMSYFFSSSNSGNHGSMAGMPRYATVSAFSQNVLRPIGIAEFDEAETNARRVGLAMRVAPSNTPGDDGSGSGNGNNDTPTGGNGSGTPATNLPGTTTGVPISTQNLQNMGLLWYEINEIKRKLASGYIPVIVKNFSGQYVIQWVKKPTSADAKILIAVEYKITSFLGDYGAGKTVKTFSLLPGEKTNISIKSYKSFEKTDSRTDNVLDSFSNKSSDSLEKLVEQETSRSKVNTKGVGVNLGIGKLKVDMSSKTQTQTQSRTLNRALTKHVEESQAERKVEVKTETSTTYKEGEENEITREIKNVNQSRVLNFTFKQLNQEYVTVTYIDDASLYFTNGFDELDEAGKLYDLDSFLEKFLVDDTAVNQVKKLVLSNLVNLANNRGEFKSLIKKSTYTLKDPENMNQNLVDDNGQNVTINYWGKDDQLKEAVTVGGRTIDINGIITQIEKHVLSTDSVIVDALLGQGEALDCYNTQLQNIAVVKERAAVLEKIEEIDIKNNVPITKSTEFKDVFGKCCDDAILKAIGK